MEQKHILLLVLAGMLLGGFAIGYAGGSYFTHTEWEKYTEWSEDWLNKHCTCSDDALEPDWINIPVVLQNG